MVLHKDDADRASGGIQREIANAKQWTVIGFLIDGTHELMVATCVEGDVIARCRFGADGLTVEDDLSRWAEVIHAETAVEAESLAKERAATEDPDWD
jgi:hypothetical protein